jgi:hypothetical protein
MQGKIREYCLGKHMHNPWSRVFSRPSGRLILLCGLVCIALFIATFVQTYVYFQQVMDDVNIMCASPWAHCWGLMSPFLYVGLIIATLSLFWVYSCRIQTSRWYMYGTIGAIFAYIPSILIAIGSCPSSVDSGAIIQRGNSSIMYQYIFMDHQAYAYPVVLDIDDINITGLNLTCDSMKTSDLCIGWDRLLRANFSEISLCHPSDDEGLHYVMSYLEPSSSRAHSAVSLSIALLVLFWPTLILVLFRRLVPEHYWCETRLCRPHELTERSPLFAL